MANPKLPPPPYKTPMLDENGLMTTPWVNWIREVIQRLQEIDLAVFP